MKRYRAFISYNQKDKTVVKKLHRWLETYRVPHGVPAEVELGPGRRLGRFFRDDEEMGASSDIGGAVRGAIEDAESLIIICSPNAAKSKWVDAEIQHFRKIGRDRKVFAVIVEGTPNSGDPKTECFPPSLRVAADPDDPASMPIEPLALDLRKEGRARLLARLTAGLLEVNFDTLWNRDRRRARARRDTVLSTLLGGVLALGVAGGIILRGQNAERSAQLVSAAQAQADAGAHESALRLSVLAMREHLLMPAAEDAEAMLARASHETLALSVEARHQGAVTAIAASQDGRWLASASDNVFELDAREFALTDRETGVRSQAFPRVPSARIESLSFSPDGTRLVIAGYEDFPRVHDVETGEVLFALEGERYVPAHMDAHSPVPTEEIGEFAYAASYSPDGAYIAANSSLGGMRVFDAETGDLVLRHPAVEALPGISPAAPPFAADFRFTPGGLLIASTSSYGGSSSDAFQIYDPQRAATVRMIQRPRPDSGRVLTLEATALSEDGRIFVAAWRDGYLAAWNIATGEPVAVYPGAPQDWGVRALVADTGLDRLTLVGPEGQVHAWTLSGGTPIFTLPGRDQRMTAAHVEPDGRTVLMVFEDGLARLMDIPMGLVLREHRAEMATVAYGGLATDGRGTVFTGDDEGGVRAWRARSALEVAPINGLSSAIGDTQFGTNYPESFSLSRLGETLLIKYLFRDAVSWRTEGGEPPQAIRTGGAQLRFAALSPDGAVALLDYGPQVSGKVLWDVEARQAIGALGPPEPNEPLDAAMSASFSDDGSTLLIGYESLSARVFRRDGDDWRLAHTVSESVEAHADLYSEGQIPTTVVALSTDGSRALVASDTGRIRLLDARSGETISELDSAADGMAGAAFSPDGRTVAVQYRQFVSTGDMEPKATLWARAGSGDEERWVETRVLAAREGGASALFFSRDGARLFTVAADTVLVWDVASGRRLADEPIGQSLFRAASSLHQDGRGVLTLLEADFRDRNAPRSPAFRHEGAALAFDFEWLVGTVDRERLGLTPLKRAVCDPVTGVLGADLRDIRREDVEAVPSLEGRIGEDVCAPPDMAYEFARLIPALGPGSDG